MSLYSVKVSLKLRAGVAQRPIFACSALWGYYTSAVIRLGLTSTLFREALTFFCCQVRGLVRRLQEKSSHKELKSVKII